MEISYEDTPDVWPDAARQKFRLRTAKQRAVIAQGDRDRVRDIVNIVADGGLVPETAYALATGAVALAIVAHAEGVTPDA